jgi:hypothetical protein
MGEKTNGTDRIRLSQVVAGALAAVTAALAGSTMGVAGTVVGAGLASVISTLGGALYLRSIQRTGDGVRMVRAKVVGRTGDAAVMVSAEEPEAAPATGEEVAVEAAQDDRPPSARRRVRLAILALTCLAAFALGMGAITGVEWLRGESLSGGNGTTFGEVVSPRGGHGTDSGTDTGPADPSTPASTTTPPPAPTTGTPSAGPTTTTTTPPSGSSAPGTTTRPPATSTTEGSASSLPVPSSR